MKTNLQSGVSIIQVILALAVGAVLFGVISLFTSSNEPAAVTQTGENNAEMESIDESMVDDMDEAMIDPVNQAVEAENTIMEDEMDKIDVGMTDDDVQSASESVSIAPAGTFQDYSADKLALASNGTVALFFHANWCPSCRSLENDINANLSDIPANTHILKLDYDTETELKKKYGVVRQHTIVVVDADGNELKKLTGLTNTLEQVVSQL